MKVLVTGANGFIGKNLVSHLKEKKDIELCLFTEDSSIDSLSEMVNKVDFIFHLAGVNRPIEISEFQSINRGLTETICNLVRNTNKKIPIVFTSSTQAILDNEYGKSKLEAEDALNKLNYETQNPVYIFRLPNVFGKWCRPNYNSVVATFCYNISHGLPIQISNPKNEINLVYIDDVIDSFLKILENPTEVNDKCDVEPIYKINLQDLADTIYAFKNSRDSLITERVGNGLTRALYSTYISYLEPDLFSYEVQIHGDSRGVFVEMLKTKDSGQFSFFTAHPGITRGGHYHHSKTEKFLVIKGNARFNFRHIVTNEIFSKYTSSDKPEIVETIPGWAHDITNIGDNEMIVMLWANEIFDRQRPDTYSYKV